MTVFRFRRQSLELSELTRRCSSYVILVAQRGIDHDYLQSIRHCHRLLRY